MKTRRILSGISALVIAATMAVPFSAFAEDTATKTINTDGGSDSTNVIYDATEKYFVTIPAGITLKDTAVTADITANDVIIREGKIIKVTLSSADNTESGNLFSAKNSAKNSTVSYNINNGTVSVGDVIAKFDKNNLTETLTFTKTDDAIPTRAGKHSENLTFTIGVEDDKTNVSGVEIDNKTTIATAITRGGTLNLTASVDESATDKTVVWSSSDNSILEVATTDTGVTVTAKKTGTATIKVTATNGTPEDISDDQTDSITITVNPIMYAVSFSANGGTGTMDNVSVAENSEYTLPANSFTAPTGQEFDKWQIGDNTYADGAKVTITGDTAVNATWKDVNYAVTMGTFTNGTVTADSTAKMGDTVTLTVTPDTGYELDTLTVTDASNNSVPVTGNKFTMPNSDVTVSATFKSSIITVSGITINNAPTEALFVNSTGTLTATVSPDNATDKTVVWSSSDPDYVSINAETGEYTIMGTKGYGSATITATATNGTEDTSDDVSAACTITGKVTYTSLSPGTVLHVGDTFYAGQVYFATKPLMSFNDSNGVITLVEDNGCYKFKRGSNGTMPNVTAYKVKDNTDGVYIVSGSGTSSDRFTIAVHTKDQ